MSLDLFRAIGGVNLQNDAGTVNASVLMGTNAPGGDGSFQDAAAIGSIYLRTNAGTNNLQLYFKFQTVGNSAADWKLVTDKVYVDAVMTALTTTRGSGNITNTGGNWVLSSDFLWSAGSPAGTLDVTTAFDAVNIAIGNRTYSAQNFINDGETITASLDALDVALGGVSSPTITGTNVDASGTITADELATTVASQIKWLIQIRENGTPANRRGYEIHAITDGTNADHTCFAILRLGVAIAGLVVTVDVSGGNIRLRVTATPTIDFAVKRATYSVFA